MERPVVVFDLDGTLYRGDAPYQYYAKVVSRFLDHEEARIYLRRVDDHLQGHGTLEAADNWEAVVRLMEPFGEKLSLDQWQEAFRDTRQYMLSQDCVLEIPPEIKTLFDDIRGEAFLALVTNSPYDAAGPLLEQLGLMGCFDIIRTEAQKPGGIVKLVKEIAGRDYRPERIFSVGDHYHNDIAPGVQEGWTTGHISPRRVFPGPATYQVAQAEELFDAIRTWVQRTRAENERKTVE